MTSGAPTRMAAWLESAWLARYLERQLDGEELAWFEAYLLDKPELLGMVEADNALRDGLTVTQGGHSSIPAARRKVRGAELGMAAALFAGIGVGWFADHASVEGFPEVIPNPPRIVLDTERGQSVAPQIENAGTKAAYRLIEVSVPLGSSDARIRLSNGKQYPVRISPDSFVSFLVAADADVKTLELTYIVDQKSIQRIVPVDPLVGDAQ